MFFVLLETSIKKGVRHAIFLDIGVLLSDVLYLTASFFFAQEINDKLNENPYVNYIAGGIFIVIGLVSIIKKSSYLKNTSTIDLDSINSVQKGDKVFGFKKRTYVALIAKGIGLNAINPGVLIYWIAACTYATEELLISGNNLIYYFSATLITMFSVDLLKIYFASKLKSRLNNKNLALMSIIIGTALIVFGIAICLRDFHA
jgi:threonine/homoserine/homoserine lactone efflux protein